MKKSMTSMGLLCVTFLIASVAYAVDIDAPPYVNLTPGSMGDGGLDFTESVSLLSGTSYGHGTISFTFTNTSGVEILSAQFIPNIMLWQWFVAKGDSPQDKMYVQSVTGNTVRYANTIGGLAFVTDITFPSAVTVYDVDNAFPAFWTFPWTAYGAGVDLANPNTFYGYILGDLSPGEWVSITVQTYTTVNGTQFPDTEWGNPQGLGTQFDLDWDDVGIPIPEPMTVTLLGSALAVFFARRLRHR